MTTIYLMRHGHTSNPDNVFYGSEFELSEQGKRQAGNLAKDMRDQGISPVLSRCSPFTRTQQTCHIVNEVLEIKDKIVDDRLMEWNAGPWFNKPLKDFYAATKYNETPPRLEDPRVERLEDMAQRVIAVIDEVKIQAKGSSALLVSHREPLVGAMLTLQGLSFDTIHTFDCHVASVWELSYDDEGKLIGLRKAFDHHQDA